MKTKNELSRFNFIYITLFWQKNVKYLDFK